MNYTTTYRDRPDYLLFHVRSPFISSDVSEGYVHSLRHACEETGHTRAVLMRDIPSMLEKVTYYKATDEWRKPLDGIRIAWVNPYPQNHAILEFVIELANHRGSDFGLFAKFDDAIAWMNRRALAPDRSVARFPRLPVPAC